MSKYVNDMTSGNEVKLLLGFALPMFIGNTFQQFYNMADSIIVGRYVGSKQLGAVGSVGNLTFLFFSLCMGLGAGVGILIAQFFGAGKDHQVKCTIANSVYITCIVGFLMSFIGVVLASPILHLMNTPAENFNDALVYMRIVCGNIIMVAIYNTVSSILRALGDSKTPLIFLIISCFINIALDLLFVIQFRMGVAGAALATVVAQVFTTVGLIIYALLKNPYMKLHKEHFQPNKEVIKKCFRIGLPLAAQNALIAFSCVALQRVVNHFGATVMAAYTATSRVEQLVQQPYGSLATALSTFAGQNTGAGKYDRVSQGCKKSVYIVAVFSAMMVAVMFMFGNNIVSIFVNEPDVIEIGTMGLKITSVMYFFLGLIYIMRGMLNGVGDAMFSMINGVTEVIGRIGFAWILMLIPFVGMWCVWWTNGLTWCITAIASVIRVKSGKWRQKSMVN